MDTFFLILELIGTVAFAVSGAAVAITKAMPTTVTLNSCIRSTMPLAVPPPLRKSSTIRARVPSRTARRARDMVWMVPEEPET